VEDSFPLKIGLGIKWSNIIYINYIIVITINPHVGWLDAYIPSTPHKYPSFIRNSALDVARIQPDAEAPEREIVIPIF
jgi:hypothetical protein